MFHNQSYCLSLTSEQRIVLSNDINRRSQRGGRVVGQQGGVMIVRDTFCVHKKKIYNYLHVLLHDILTLNLHSRERRNIL